MDPIVGSASKGIDQLYTQGPLVTALVLCLIVLVLFVKKLMDKCDAKWDQSLAAQQTMGNKLLDVVQQNAIAMTKLSDSIETLKR